MSCDIFKEVVLLNSWNVLYFDTMWHALLFLAVLTHSKLFFFFIFPLALVIDTYTYTVTWIYGSYYDRGIAHR